jgi:hypothetical protein
LIQRLSSIKGITIPFSCFYALNSATKTAKAIE